MQNQLYQLEKKINYTFSSPDLLKQALTHRSFAKSQRNATIKDNERLEFFGDAILKFIVSDYLMKRFPQLDEGKLTKLRAQIIADKTLALLAQTIDLGTYLFISYSEQKTGGAQKKSLLSDAFEALLGAMYYDGGMDVVYRFLTRIIEDNEPLLFDKLSQSDYKTRLQEILQQQKEVLPTYSIKKESGPEHAKRFHINLSFSFKEKNYLLEGVGPNKKDAEQNAAKKALSTLDHV